MANNKKLERNPMNKVIGGVCSGLADYFNLDVALVRVLFVIALLFASFGFWLYLILWIVIPERNVSFDFNAQSSDKERHATGDEQTVTDNNNKKLTSIVSGVVVMLIGFVFLINNFVPISWIWKLWPLILVVIGGVMIYKSSVKGGGDE